MGSNTSSQIDSENGWRLHTMTEEIYLDLDIIFIKVRDATTDFTNGREF